MKPIIYLVALLFCEATYCQTTPNEATNTVAFDTINGINCKYLNKTIALPLLSINTCCELVLLEIIDNCDQINFASSKFCGYMFYSIVEDSCTYINVRPMELVVYDSNRYYGCFFYNDICFMCFGDFPESLFKNSNDSIQLPYYQLIPNSCISIPEYVFDKYADVNAKPIIRTVFCSDRKYTFIIQLCKDQ